MLYRFFEGTHKTNSIYFDKRNEIESISSYDLVQKELNHLMSIGYNNILVVADFGVRDLLHPRTVIDLFEVIDGKLAICEFPDHSFVELQLANGTKKASKSIHNFCKWWDNFEEKGGVATVEYFHHVTNSHGKSKMENITLVKAGEKMNRLPNWNFYSETIVKTR